MPENTSNLFGAAGRMGVLVLVLFFNIPARAEESAETVRAKAALLDAVGASLDPTPLMGYHFKWTEERFSPLPDAEYTELAATTKGRKDHPRYIVFKEAEWDRSNGPRVLEPEVWFIAPRYWRQSAVFATAWPGVVKGSFRDSAWGPDAGWTAQSAIIVITSPDDEQGKQFMQPEMNAWLDALLYFSTGGLHSIARSPGGHGGGVGTRPGRGSI